MSILSNPTTSEMVMWSERELDLLMFERARLSGVVEHGIPHGDGVRQRLAGALLALASWLDRAATQQAASRLTVKRA